MSTAADDNLARLCDFLPDRVETVDNLDPARAAVDAIRSAAVNPLATTPYSLRKSGESSTRRERIIPFDATGYVGLYEIASSTGLIAAQAQRLADSVALAVTMAAEPASPRAPSAHASSLRPRNE